jgi:hypothetical protein
MTTTTFIQAEARRPAPTSPVAGGVSVGAFSRLVDTSEEATTANDKLRIAVLPAGHVVVDLMVAMAAIDGGAALVWDCGVEDTTQTNGDTSIADALVDGSDVGQTAGIQRMDQTAGVSIAPVNYDRYITITIKTPPATDADGVISGWFSSRAALRGE